jgi:hypothetical protein
MPFDTQYDFENFNSFKILLYSIFLRELLEPVNKDLTQMFVGNTSLFITYFM